jgi:hypothetical protein
MITAIRFEYPTGEAKDDDDADISASIVISLTSPGRSADGKAERPRFGPWPHGVPPIPLTLLFLSNCRLVARDRLAAGNSGILVAWKARIQADR